MAKLDWQKLKPHRLANARLYVNTHARYFNSTLYAMVPQPVEGLLEKVGGPMGLTEKLVLLYDPEWVEKEDELILATGLVHEVLHSQLHFFERSARYPDPRTFNLAQDIAMNQWLRAQTKKTGGPLWKCAEWFAQPEKWGFPPDLTADHYYKLLEQKEKNGKSQKQVGEGTGSGSEKSIQGQDGTHPDKQQNDRGDVRKGPGRKESSNAPGAVPRIGSGACGGIARNPLGRALEQHYNELQGRTPAEVGRVSRETARAIKQEAEAQQGRGFLPGNFLEIIRIDDEPEKVAWQDHLAMAARHAIGQAKVGGLDYSLSRPSRRSYLRGWPIPGLIKRDLTVAVAIDSSGSMSKDALRQAVTETSAVMRQCGVDRLWLLIVDASLQAEPRLIDVYDLVELAIPGRGGTAFTPAVEAVCKLEPRPDVTIYYTDGMGDNPEEPEDMQFIWGVIGKHKLSVTWGEEVRIE